MPTPFIPVEGGGGVEKTQKFSTVSARQSCFMLNYFGLDTHTYYNRLDYNWLIILYMQSRNCSGVAEQATEIDA